MTVKLTYVEPNKLYKSIETSVKEFTKKELLKYDKLNPETLIDIQGNIERYIRKEFVLSGKILDFRIFEFCISTKNKTISCCCCANIPSWYAHEDEKDNLSCDPLLDGEDFIVTIPDNISINVDDFKLEATSFEECRDEECDKYAKTYRFKRFACSKYDIDDMYFARAK